MELCFGDSHALAAPPVLPARYCRQFFRGEGAIIDRGQGLAAHDEEGISLVGGVKTVASLGEGDVWEGSDDGGVDVDHAGLLLRLGLGLGLGLETRIWLEGR